MAKSRSALPQRKITVSVLAGAIVTLVIPLIEEYGKITVTNQYASALTTIVSFALGYWTPPGKGEIIDD